MAKNSEVIRFCLAGVAGKMGREVVKFLPHWDGIELVSVIGLRSAGKNLRTMYGKDAPSLVIASDVKEALEKSKPHVLLDLTEPNAALKNALCSLQCGVAPIIGTSGLRPPDIEEISIECKKRKVPAMLVPNFSLGAVLGIEFAKIAAKWLSNVEIIELHHDQKLDAPSGTAIETARQIQESRTQPSTIPETRFIKVQGVRGGKYADVPIHSIRLNGIIAQQNTIFGSEGETLEIKHTVTDRSTYMKGVELSIRGILSQNGMVIGLDTLLFKQQEESHRW